MLFHSQIFLLVFLPLALLLFYKFPLSSSGRQWLLITFSLVFYSWWDIRFLPLIVASVVVNWCLANACRRHEFHAAPILGVVVNLGLLGYFKYRNFFLENLLEIFGEVPVYDNLILPIGISFFTFQQISYLVDLRREQTPLYDFRRYAVYVTFFPQLIAGPIVRHDELIHQLSDWPKRDGLNERMARGGVLFIIGLAKKVLLADHFAKHADRVFEAATNGAVGTLDAWSGTLAFAFQIYFDFSAYSDMALGLGLLFGLVLPVNFNSPYKAVSVGEFWRRWHISLSRFLRDYLYIPLGGNRHGLLRQTAAQMITMLLCGLWHGAGWNFVLWGGYHGVGLVINNLWRRFGFSIPSVVSWGLTMGFVTIGWVLFRAVDFAAATAMLQSMVGISPGAPQSLAGFAGWKLAAAGVLVLAFPNSQRLALEMLAPNRLIAGFLALLLVFITLELGKGQSIEFIYFQF